MSLPSRRSRRLPGNGSSSSNRTPILTEREQLVKVKNMSITLSTRRSSSNNNNNNNPLSSRRSAMAVSKFSSRALKKKNIPSARSKNGSTSRSRRRRRPQSAPRLRTTNSNPNNNNNNNRIYIDDNLSSSTKDKYKVSSSRRNVKQSSRLTTSRIQEMNKQNNSNNTPFVEWSIKDGNNNNNNNSNRKSNRSNNTNKISSNNTTEIERRIMEKIHNQRIVEKASDMYRRLSERATQKFGRIDESFLHDYHVDDDGLIPFDAFWETVNGIYGKQISKTTARKIFDLTDDDGDGKISINELRESYDKANMKLHSARVIDVNNINKRDRTPIVDKIIKQIRQVYKDKSSLLNVFRAADEDHNGYVNEIEMQHVLSGLGLSTSLKECGELCDYFDADGDGKIEYDEFIAFISTQGGEHHEQHHKEEKNKGIPEGLKELHAMQERLLQRNQSIEGPKEKTVGIDTVAKIIRDKYGRRNSLRKVFRDWDIDKNGKVSKEEMLDILHHMDVKMKDDDFESLYEKFDEDHEEGVSYNEFIDFIFPANPDQDAHIKLKLEQEKMRLEAEKIKNVTPGTLEEAMLIEKIKKSVFERLSRKGNKGTLKEAFRKFDLDHDGQVTYDEFRTGMKNLDSRLTDGHIDILLSQFDKDNSGSIDYLEFVANASEQNNENVMMQYHSRLKRSNTERGHLLRKSGQTRARRRPATAIAGLTLHKSASASLAKAASASNLGALNSKRNFMPYTERMRRKRLKYIIPPSGSSRERHFHFKALYNRKHVPRKDSNTPYYDTRNLINLPDEGNNFQTRRFNIDHDHGYYTTNISALHSRPLSQHAGHRAENIEQARSDLKESRRWGRIKRKQENFARIYKNEIEPNRYREEDKREAKVTSLLRQRMNYFKSLEHRFEQDAALQKVCGFVKANDKNKSENKIY